MLFTVPAVTSKSVARLLKQHSSVIPLLFPTTSAVRTLLLRKRAALPTIASLSRCAGCTTQHRTLQGSSSSSNSNNTSNALLHAQRHYATAASSNSGGGSSSDSKSSGGSSGAATSGSSSAAEKTHTGAGGSNSSGHGASTNHHNSSSSSGSHGGGGGGSGQGQSGNAAAASRQAKKLKMKGKKNKTMRRVKRKRAPATPSPTKASASSPSTTSGAAANTGPSSGSSGTNNNNSGSNSSRKSSNGARRSPSARGRTAARRRKSKLRSSSSSAGSGTSAPAAAAGAGGTNAGAATGAASTTGGAATAAKAKHGSAARKAMISSKSGHGKRAGAAGAGARNSSGRTGARSGHVTPASGKSTGVAASTSSAKSLARSKKKQHKKIRVCVLTSSYDGADSATASVDNYWCTPQHYMKKDRHKYTFADVSMKKIDSYRTVRELVTSNKYDVFFNLCDGGRDEKRAGVDVVEALEEHNAAFTGTDSRSFEPSKIDMKLMVGSSGVKVPNFVLLENEESLAKKCRHLKFPVIVKHLSGYASVGINKDNRCDNLDQLKTKVRGFIKEYNHALVEEFIRGREGTVLACADPSSPYGVKVFKPLMFSFLQNNDDFAYFDKKWTMECNDQAYKFLPSSDPAYPAIVEMARNAFKYIMNGVGYGRVDFRIDEQSGAPYFLEINPNCGMWYSPKDGGDFADVMVEGDPHWNHERFIANAVARALKEQAARKPWYFISHDRNGQFSTRASKTVPEGKCLFGDAIHPIPVVSKALYKLGEEDPTVGCVICRGDGIHHAVALRHSCEPNMHFVHGRTLLFAAKRQISVGEELTVDYATLRDEAMPHFVCSCGTQNCRSVIFPMPATARTVEAKAMKRLLREKRLVWLKEKADREAERILKKRSSSSSSAGSGASGSGAGGSSGGASSSSSNGASSSSSNSGSSNSSSSGSDKKI